MRRINGGGVIEETCPSWCAGDHQDDQATDLDDLAHSSTVTALQMRVNAAAPSPLLSAAILQSPYEDVTSERVTPRAPYVVFAPSDDDFTIELDADGLADVIAQIRQHADRLVQVRNQLMALRTGMKGTAAMSDGL
ncbi:hypothetical protein AB0M86_48675 [Streptomyces sp. NPDC051639]|uniref:DUF6907 domain-containing protein n=1 Tax=Streptomyces sp. NPDC051639 TaxID=3155671 RepID=UPI0034149C8F